MHKATCVLAGTLAMAGACSGAELEAKEWKADDGTVVPYRWAVPQKVEEGKLYPLVLFLHGAGERGTDNTAQTKHGVAAILEGAKKLGEPCYLIAPQCPPEHWWAPPAEGRLGLRAAKEPNPRLDPVLALVEELMAEHPVDPARFYVTGLSMGGFGTWDLLGRVPERIAAAVPVCGGGDTSLVEKFKNVPVWAFHGEDDEAVPVAATKNMITALETAGGSPKVTYYPDTGHDSWTATYSNPEVIRWIFQQKKAVP